MSDNTSRISGALMAVASVLLLLSEYSSRIEFAVAGAMLVGGFIALEWFRLPLAGQLLGIGGLAMIGVAFLAPDPLILIIDGLERATYMCAFFVLVGITRAAAEDSEIVRRCGRQLLAQKPGTRYLALWTGGTLYGAVISVGVLSLFGSMIKGANTLASAGGDERVQAIRAKRSMMALMRGFTTALLWSPMSISLAVVLTSLPSLNWQAVLTIGVGMAVVFYFLGWQVDRLTHRPSGQVVAPPKAEDGWSVQLFPLVLILATFAIAWNLEHWGGVAFIAGVMTGAPIVCALWLAVQAVKRPGAQLLQHTRRRFMVYATDMVPQQRMQMTILATAGFAGAVIGYFLEPEMVAAALDWIGAPAFVVPALVMAFIIGGGLAGLNAIITVMIIGGALPHPEVFGVQPVILGATYLTAWSLTVGNSPVAMSTLLIGSFVDRSGAVVGLRWNGWYTFLGYAGASFALGAAVAIFPA